MHKQQLIREHCVHVTREGFSLSVAWRMRTGRHVSCRPHRHITGTVSTGVQSSSTSVVSLRMPPRQARSSSGGGGGGGGGGRTSLLLHKANLIPDPTSQLCTEQLSFTVSRNIPHTDHHHNTHTEITPSHTHTTHSNNTHPEAIPPPTCVPLHDPPPIPSQQQQYHVHVQHYSASALPPELHEWAFQLVRDALRDQYKPIWGWKDEDKRQQLRAASSRFLVAWASPTTPPMSQPQQTQPHSPQQQQQQGTSSDSSPQIADQAPLAPPPPPPPQQQSVTQSITLVDQASVSVHLNHESTTDITEGAHDNKHIGSKTNPTSHMCDVQQGRDAGGADDAAQGGHTLPLTSERSATLGLSESLTAAAPLGSVAPAPLSPAPFSPVPAAYINYRFEEGYYKDPVLYVYEVMVSPAWQRLGLASRLMRMVELAAWEAGMDRVLLTVLVSNKAAGALYRSLHYKTDKASPGTSSGYQILSKEKPASKDPQGSKGRAAGTGGVKKTPAGATAVRKKK